MTNKIERLLILKKEHNNQLLSLIILKTQTETLKPPNSKMSLSLPAFFQPSPNTNIVFESLEESTENQNHNQMVNEYDAEEDITRALRIFFFGVSYENMAEYFHSFECGDVAMLTPLFTDEFTLLHLPIRFKRMLFELNAILDIRNNIDAEWISEDARYESLCESQQNDLRRIIHSDPAKHHQLDDLYNRLKGYRSRTPHLEIKFLLNYTMDVVQDILRKNMD